MSHRLIYGQSVEIQSDTNTETSSTKTVNSSTINLNASSSLAVTSPAVTLGGTTSMTINSPVLKINGLPFPSPFPQTDVSVFPFNAFGVFPFPANSVLFRFIKSIDGASVTMSVKFSGTLSPLTCSSTGQQIWNNVIPAGFQPTSSTLVFPMIIYNNGANTFASFATSSFLGGGIIFAPSTVIPLNFTAGQVLNVGGMAYSWTYTINGP